MSQADRVGRYIGAGDADPSLTRLGSGEWVRAKAKVRRSVRDLAQELMELYGARAALEGHAYPADSPWQFELEGSFPYEETPDQVQAIHDVKTDMQSPRPMDRLLVGDVGFGKTEVALRAAFKAVQDGRQVAVLVPTTVLAQQHFNTFRERLGAFPVKVEMLSRFRSDKEQREIIAGLASGSVDICIGTHRLVQRDVEFKNLGLVVIDEEQRFGVAHKERLKQLRREVDVLTLTATPIPRTLHMGLVGVRDMSVLETAPEARLPVRTYVTEYDDGLVQEAILREIDRGGQVYFVNNRVQGIETIANRLRRLVPEARVAVGHGQMPEDQLEQTMLGFAEGDFDVLVCTTIIESGLDIPNANTLIVNSAHRFGLAQLYQLRGRVGRSASRAYAYLLYAKDMALSEIAQERLEDDLRGHRAGRGHAHRDEGPRDPRRRQPARLGAERPHRRGRLRPVHQAAGRAGRSAQGAPRRLGAADRARLAVARPAAERVHPARIRARRSGATAAVPALFGHLEMASWRPGRRARGPSRCDRHLHDVGDLDRAAFAFSLIGDRHGLDAKHLPDQRGEPAHDAACGTGEDGLQGFLLSLVSPLIDVERHRPVPLDHRTRGTGDHGRVEPAERDLTEGALIEVKGKARPHTLLRSGLEVNGAAAEKMQGHATVQLQFSKYSPRSDHVGLLSRPSLPPSV